MCWLTNVFSYVLLRSLAGKTNEAERSLTNVLTYTLREKPTKRNVLLLMC